MTKKNYRTRNKTRLAMIQNYIEVRRDWVNYPAKIICGEMWVLIYGHWINQEECDEFIPIPNVATFVVKREDIDGTHI